MANERTYEIAAASKVFRVLEAVHSDTGEAVRFLRIVERTGFSKNFVLRAIKTLELNGYVQCIGGNRWVYGKRFLSLVGGDRL